MQDDPWLRRLWLANGIVLLPLLLFAVWSAGSDLIGRREGTPTVEVTTPRSSEAPRAVRYDQPEAIRGSTTRLVQVRYGVAYQPKDALAYGLSEPYESAWRQPVVNVLFIDSLGGARLLLDRPAFIRRVDPPTHDSDSLQTWIAYEVAFNDTDGDGRLGETDQFNLLVTDLHGRRQQLVLPDTLTLLSYKLFQPGRILIYTLAGSSRANMSEGQRAQRAFVYDLERRNLAPFAVVDDETGRAARILAR